MKAKPGDIEVKPGDIEVRYAEDMGTIFKDKKGVHVVEGGDMGKLVASLIPRESMLEKQPQRGDKVFELLSQIEKQVPKTKRGKGKLLLFEGASDKYWIVGKKVPQGQRGLSEASIPDTVVGDALVKLIRRFEDLMAMHLDTDTLLAYKEAQSLLDFETITNEDGTKSLVFPSIAGGVNVFLTAHTDDDSFLSVATVQAKPQNGTKYEADDDICCYFTFPEYDFAIAMRPGDVLVFNPKTYHCVSSRCQDSQDFLCLSLYVKARVVGGNDNSLPLTDEQKEAMEKCKL